MCAAKSNTVHVLNYQNPRSEKSVKIIRLYLVAAPPRFPRTLHGWCGVSEILLQSSSNLPGDLLQKLWSEKWRVDSRASNEGYPKVRKDFTIMEKAPTDHGLVIFAVWAWSAVVYLLSRRGRTCEI